MGKEKLAYIERTVDKNGIKRIYGYTIDGKKYFLNIAEVLEEYDKKGIRGQLERV